MSPLSLRSFSPVLFLPLCLVRIRGLMNRLARITLAMCAIMIGGTAIAQNSTTTTVTSSLNPSGIGESVTFTAKVAPTADYLVVYPAMFGTSSIQRRYYRYDLSGTTFGVDVTPADFTNLTRPAAFANTAVVFGGRVGDSFVALQVTADSEGIASTDQLQLFVQTAQAATGQTPTISVGVFETATGVQTNTEALQRLGPTNLSAFAVPNVPTGAVDFLADGVTISGCAGLVLDTTGTARCTTSFSTAGTRAITVPYPGDGNNLGSVGSLTGGQAVSLPILPATLPTVSVGTAIPAITFTSSNGVAPYVFRVVSGTLPSGLTLSSDGTLTGVPTIVGVYMFTIGVVDAASANGARSYSMSVSRGVQTITFNAPSTGVAGRTIQLNATSSAGLPVSYTASPNTVCTVAGSSLTFVAIGTCNVTASQAGDANVQAATPVSVSIAVSTVPIVRSLFLRNATTAQMQRMDLAGATMQTTSVGDPGLSFRVLGRVDLTGNGLVDLVYQNTTQGDFGDVRVWPDEISARDFLLRQLRLTWRLEAVGDLDGDGLGDLVWRFTGQSPNIDDQGVSYIWFTNGNAVTQVRKRGGAPLTWTLLGAMDVNRDGAADMVYVSPTNEVRLLMATPTRTCANVNASSLSSGFVPLRLADFTGQSRADVLARNPSTGQTQLLSLSGIGLTLPPYTGDPNDQNASCTPSGLNAVTALNTLAATDPSWSFYGAADFNGDGVTDILWLRPNGQLTLWLMRANNQAPFVLDNVGTAPAGFTVVPF